MSRNITIPSLLILTILASDAWAGKVYWKFKRANLDGSGVENLMPFSSWDTNWFTLHPSTGKRYYGVYSSSVGGSIGVRNLDGTAGPSGGVGAVWLGYGSRPTGMAIDQRTELIYVADELAHKILRFGPHTAIEEVATGLGHPLGVALDVAFGKVYWTAGLSNKIQRAPMEGGPVQDMVTTGLDAPSGIAIDDVNAMMYWTDSGTDKIQRANLAIPQGQTPANRTDIDDLVTGLTGVFGIALDIVEGKMYWTDNSGVSRANLDGTQIELIVAEPGLGAFGIAVIPDATIAVPVGDMNQDGVVNGSDIDPFVRQIVGR